MPLRHFGLKSLLYGGYLRHFPSCPAGLTNQINKISVSTISTISTVSRNPYIATISASRGVSAGVSGGAA